METRLFLSALVAAMLALSCGPREPSVDPATVGFRGAILGTDSRNRRSEIGLTLSGPDLETVYRDVTLASDNIRLERGMGAEIMFGGGEGKIFAINQDVPGEGYLAERSRRILAKAMEQHLKNLPAIPDAKSVSICQWDLAVTTAALYVKPVNIQAVFKNLAELPDGILRYDTGNHIFQIRFGLPGEHELQISLCFSKPWKEVRSDFPQPLRTLMDEANRIAVQDFTQKQAWKKANPGKTVPRSFLAPSSASVVYLDKG